MFDFDSWLFRSAEAFYTGCEPEIISAEQVYEGCDEEGRIEYSTNYIYNCEGCDNEECEHWKDYN